MTWQNRDVVKVLEADGHANAMAHENWSDPLAEANADVIYDRWEQLLDALIENPDSDEAKAALIAHAEVVLAFQW